jgi:hypothetical protein
MPEENERSVGNLQLRIELQIIKNKLKADGQPDQIWAPFDEVVGVIETMSEACGDHVVSAEYEECKASLAEINVARDLFQEEGEIEIDDDASASRTEEGSWVQAWLWIGETP